MFLYFLWALTHFGSIYIWFGVCIDNSICMWILVCLCTFQCAYSSLGVCQAWPISISLMCNYTLICIFCICICIWTLVCILLLSTSGHKPSFRGPWLTFWITCRFCTYYSSSSCFLFVTYHVVQIKLKNISDLCLNWGYRGLPV